MVLQQPVLLPKSQQVQAVPSSVCWMLSCKTDIGKCHTMVLSAVKDPKSCGLYSPTRALRMALLMATTASSWPMTLVCRVSSILISFSLSSLLTFSMGIPAADEVPGHQTGAEQLVELSTCVHAIRSQLCWKHVGSREDSLHVAAWHDAKEVGQNLACVFAQQQSLHNRRQQNMLLLQQ